MGGKSSREGSWRQTSSLRSDSRSGSYSWGSQYGFSQSPYGYEHQNFAPETSYGPQPSYASQPSYALQQSYASQPYYPPPSTSQDNRSGNKTFERKYSRIADNYNSLEQVRSHGRGTKEG